MIGAATQKVLEGFGIRADLCPETFTSEALALALAEKAQPEEEILLLRSASGTPVLTTRLTGIPEEYAPYVFFIEEESADGVAQALKQVLALSDEALFAKGAEAREFVLTQRNNVVQAKKILDMLK